MSEGEQASLGLQDTSRVESVEEYQFEPIKGYPFLHWQGKRPFTSTQYYPAQLNSIKLKLSSNRRQCNINGSPHKWSTKCRYANNQ